MFIPKNSDGVYELDPNELKPETWELERAEFLLREREKHQGRQMTYPSDCIHADAPCRSRRECLGKVVWWRRYMREIEGWA